MSIAVDRSDRERDGLLGAVRRFRVEAAERNRELGGWVEGERIPLEEARYDPDGRRTEWVFFDETGAVAKRYEYGYDADGRRAASVVYDAGGEPVERVAYRYDASDLLVGDTVLDARRTPAVSYGYDYRRRGRRQRITRARSDGSPGRREVLIYNDRGDTVETYVYSPEKSLDHKWVYHYDKAGNRTAEISYWPDGSFRSKELRRYDEHNNERKVAIFRPDGSLSLKWAYTYALDDRGNWIRRTVHLQSRELGRRRYRPVGVEYRTIEYY